ncbi:3'(2'),5'-bisphosphate nucleotidase CysQ [Candidatus Sumerlaeota bacterium]|nr:3'(2'),5'-bisphosphate nucleotidase CysQ [Candidatus Sumerlaeota bacterium]
MTTIDLRKCCENARQAALLAWKKIAHFHRGKFRIIEKKGEGPATEADLLADEIITTYLRERHDARDFGFLTEETEKDPIRLGKAYCWIIDPIDGTRDFIEGLQDFAIQIGLSGGGDEQGQDPLMGVLYLPAHGVLFSAVAGGGAWREDIRTGTKERIAVSQQADPKAMNLVATRSHWGNRMTAVVERLQPAHMARKGSLGVKLCDVASAVADAYVNTARGQCKEWDTCAPHAVLLEAGGTLTDLKGNAVRYNRKNYVIEHGLLATNKVLHEQLAAQVRSIPILWQD